MSKIKNSVIDDLNKHQSDTSEQLYHITVNRSALMLIAQCVEDISRFVSGQPELSNTIGTMLANCDDSCDKRDEIEKYLFSVKKVLLPELSMNSSYSYNGGNQKNLLRKNLIENTDQIYREIYHQVALVEKWDNVYSGETLPSGGLKKIVVKAID